MSSPQAEGCYILLPVSFTPDIPALTSAIGKYPAHMYVIHIIALLVPLTYVLQCIARKVPELCKAYTPGKTDQDVHVRLARLEHIVEAALPQYWSQGHGHTAGSPDTQSDRRRSMSPGADDGNRSQPEDEDPCEGMFDSGRWYGKSASGSVAAPVVLEQVRWPNHIDAHRSDRMRSCGTLGIHQAVSFPPISFNRQQRSCPRKNPMQPIGCKGSFRTTASPPRKCRNSSQNCPHAICQIALWIITSPLCTYFAWYPNA